MANTSDTSDRFEGIALIEHSLHLATVAI
jgi:hypothetical protein